MKIMFVCHGNICRSPMAECIFKELVKKAGLDGKYLASSSATSNEEIGYDGVGSPVYPPARDQLLKHGLDAGDKRASQL
ncbi:MAG: low molecular weight phosphotyrosine protein phosphatase, partial [Clostridia bacterium]|nr:low molecular weight phosphotyrosine protein phosphatase [Clostridia bacterium]